ncbi:dr1-associated corepressor homolog [Penaeus japonicus]|uniref:dr1-associated corepressor homolog n=1 Tax=Penaeus japonicus TaxID=27405 RepID=UPI001C713124|nr:dr1-associated corepressor homolog [Penaeus japonicus]
MASPLLDLPHFRDEPAWSASHLAAHALPHPTCRLSPALSPYWSSGSEGVAHLPTSEHPIELQKSKIDRSSDAIAPRRPWRTTNISDASLFYRSVLIASEKARNTDLFCSSASLNGASSCEDVSMGLEGRKELQEGEGAGRNFTCGWGSNVVYNSNKWTAQSHILPPTPPPEDARKQKRSEATRLIPVLFGKFMDPDSIDSDATYGLFLRLRQILDPVEESEQGYIQQTPRVVPHRTRYGSTNNSITANTKDNRTTNNNNNPTDNTNNNSTANTNNNPKTNTNNNTNANTNKNPTANANNNPKASTNKKPTANTNNNPKANTNNNTNANTNNNPSANTNNITKPP